jgi:hypothetical protein
MFAGRQLAVFRCPPKPASYRRFTAGTTPRKVATHRVRFRPAGKRALNAQTAGRISRIAMQVNRAAQQEAHHFEDRRRLLGRDPIGPGTGLVAIHHAPKQALLTAEGRIKTGAGDPEGLCQVRDRRSFISSTPEKSESALDGLLHIEFARSSGTHEAAFMLSMPGL